MRLLSLAIGLIGAVTLSNVCSGQVLDNPFSQYFERDITISPGAGNAKAANAAIHTIDPWPSYAGNTSIPGDGRSTVNSVEGMYRVPDPFERQLGVVTGASSRSTPGGGTSATGFETGTAIGAGAATPMQPVGNGY
jgi:hypothetical protein